MEASTPILYDSHMHTPLCKHARGKPEDYAAAAEKRGLKGIVITCHNPIPGGHSAHVRMAPNQFDEYVQMVARARETWAGRIDVRLGLESDYYPGAEAWLEELHAKVELHHVLGSVHPQIKEYRDQYDNGSPQDLFRIYYEHLAQAAESGLFDSLSHPDIVKIVYPQKWQPADILDDIKPNLDRIATTGIAMELNTSGLQKPLNEMNPGRLILQEMQTRNIPVIINSDAHDPHRVGADFEKAIDLLLDVGYTESSYFIERRRHRLSLETARTSLKSPVA